MIQAQLDDETAILGWLSGIPSHHGKPAAKQWAYIIRHSGPIQWVPIRGSGTEHAWSEEDEGRLDSAVAEISTRPSNPDSAIKRWRILQKELRSQWILPIEPHLLGVKRIVVITTGKLSGIPLIAIAPEYDYSYVHSARVGLLLAERNSNRKNRKLLAVGAVPGDALPGAQKEINSIRTNFESSTVLVGENANEDAINKIVFGGQLSDYSHIHFALHAVPVSTSPLASRLVLRPRSPQLKDVFREATADGVITARQVLRTWELDADLVVLSACSSGKGRSSRLEGELGFAHAMFVAGARNVVLTHWAIDDASTQLLMQRFYGNLRNGTPVSNALAEAQRHLANSGLKLDPTMLALDRARPVVRKPKSLPRSQKSVSPYQHPFYWSAFVHFGPL